MRPGPPVQASTPGATHAVLRNLIAGRCGLKKTCPVAATAPGPTRRRRAPPRWPGCLRPIPRQLRSWRPDWSACSSQTRCGLVARSPGGKGRGGREECWEGETFTWQVRAEAGHTPGHNLGFFFNPPLFPPTPLPVTAQPQPLLRRPCVWRRGSPSPGLRSDPTPRLHRAIPSLPLAAGPGDADAGLLPGAAAGQRLPAHPCHQLETRDLPGLCAQGGECSSGEGTFSL